MSRLLILVCGLVAVVAGADIADAEVRWYRYALDMRTGDTVYVEPLEPAVVKGRRYRVETDGADRVARVAIFVDVQQVAEVVYHLAPGRPWPIGYDYWAADGEQTVTVKIQRDEHGRYFLACPTPGCPSTINHWFLHEVSLTAPNPDQPEFSFLEPS